MKYFVEHTLIDVEKEMLQRTLQNLEAKLKNKRYFFIPISSHTHTHTHGRESLESAAKVA